MVIKLRTVEETIRLFPHHVRIKPAKIALGGRTRMREWLSEQQIRVYHLYGDAADVYWDTSWTNFYFKHDKHAVLFKLKWL
jgi:hypothetical protein